MSQSCIGNFLAAVYNSHSDCLGNSGVLVSDDKLSTGFGYIDSCKECGSI